MSTASALDRQGRFCSGAMMAAEATTRLRGVLLALIALLGVLGSACQPTPTLRPAPSAARVPAAPSVQAPEAQK